MELAPDGANCLNEAGLDSHVDVLVGGVEGEGPLGDLPPDGLQTILNLAGLTGFEQSNLL